MSGRDVILTYAQARLIAGELADIVRQRLADYTPVTNGHQAVILAYTRRIVRALEEVASQCGYDVMAVGDKLAAEIVAARANGFWVDESV